MGPSCSRTSLSTIHYHYHYPLSTLTLDQLISQRPHRLGQRDMVRVRVDQALHALVERRQVGIAHLPHLLDRRQIVDELAVAQHIDQQRLDERQIAGVHHAVLGLLEWMMQLHLHEVSKIFFLERHYVGDGLVPLVI